jgi:hypothetical protein
MKASEFKQLIKEEIQKVLKEVLAPVDSKLLTQHEKLKPEVYRNLMANARKGILKHMTKSDGVVHFWNPLTKEYLAKVVLYNGYGDYLHSANIDEKGNLAESINEATSIQKDLASRIHNVIEGDEANKKKILNAMHKTQSQFNPLTVKIATGYEGSSGMDNRLAYLRTLSPTKLKLVLSELNAILGIKESKLSESAMAEIDQMAQDASTFNQFAMEFFKEYPNIKQDEKMGFIKWLKTVYMEAKNNK